MDAIKADLVEPAPVVLDFSFTDTDGVKHARALALKPWTIRNEIEITAAQGGRNALAMRMANADKDPAPLFEQFCHQLEPDCREWLAEVMGADNAGDDPDPEDIAESMIDRLPRYAHNDIGGALIASQSQAWPKAEKKSLALTAMKYPLSLISTGLLIGSFATWGYLHLAG